MKNLIALEQERSALLNEWMKAKESEKVELLVRIMDIDEEIAADKEKEEEK